MLALNEARLKIKEKYEQSKQREIEKFKSNFKRVSESEMQQQLGEVRERLNAADYELKVAVTENIL
jgi:uncharacterized protein YdaT